MSTSKNYPTQQGFISYRTNVSKVASSSPNAIQTNQNHSFIMSTQKGKNTSHNSQTEHFTSIHHQNTLLKEQNKALRRQLNLIKGQFFTSQNLSTNSSVAQSLQVNDLRETIKKEAGEIKELKTRLEIVSKQCKMYEQIIDKMQGKINKLTQQNKLMELKLKQTKLHERIQKDEDGSKFSRQKFHQLTQRVNEIMAMYSQLESRASIHDKEWEAWKDQWSKQKSYYLNRIRDLEGMLGIGVQTKQFFKKRF